MDFTLSDDQRAIQDMARSFAQSEMAPHSARWDEEKYFPVEVMREAAALGFAGIYVQEDVGGSGLKRLDAAIIFEELSRGDVATAAFISIHNMASWMIDRFGSDELRRRYLPRLTTMELIASYCLTEPGSGSDAAALKTTAVRDGDHYVLNGSKTFITNGQHAGMVILAAKTDPTGGAKGVSLFLVDMNLPGCARGRNLEKMGLHAQDTSELFFDNVKLPLDSLLGDEGRGFAIMMNELPRERLNLSAGAIAASEGLLAATVAYTQERKAFGKPICQLQNTRFVLATCHTDIAINKAYVDQCVRLYMQGKLDATQAAVAKMASTDMQCRVADACLQLFGGYGYMMEYPAARAYVDARIQRIYGGTNEIMKEVIARSLVGR